MESILIISTLISFLFSLSIWKAWKWLEYKAWIEPLRFEALLKAAAFMAQAISLTASALCNFAISMAQAKDAADKMKLAVGGMEGKMLTRDADGKFVEIESMEYIGKVGEAHKVLLNTKPFEGESRIDF